MTPNGEEEPPEDDPSIDGETDLFRRVPPAHYKVVDGEFVLREEAFKNFPNPERKRMSVVLGDTLARFRRQPGSILTSEQSAYGVVAIKATAVRDEHQRIERSGREDEPAHGDVYGDKPGSRRKRLAAVAEWVVYPTVS